ncbi:hypothetical protein SYNPS1DRAFT_22574 [Syncephalis pseudoplumigaleata]|uniref:Uncharacterized protein n=1 Tax=Syncephalis pseudoplumigaleata TaxID=1712513 RepID=A0A4P9YZN9_9FUNG|nr:hypothetical protein SYNPS1DRAFT_22574 [Syncephalis pseudoplumigaleata]|eukprot:RKP25468.1 hypothetical protein SYNPS1DRAFT_22574 [Syncephalis pseudoplumigaleata]
MCQDADCTGSELYGVANMLNSALAQAIANMQMPGDSLSLSYIRSMAARFYGHLASYALCPAAIMLATIGIYLLFALAMLYVFPAPSLQTNQCQSDADTECNEQCATVESIEAADEHAVQPADGHNEPEQAELAHRVAALERSAEATVHLEDTCNAMKTRMGSLEQLLMEILDRLSEHQRKRTPLGTGLFAPAAGEASAAEVAIHGVDHLVSLKSRMTTYGSRLNQLAAPNDRALYVTRDFINARWSYPSPSESSALSSDVSPLLKPDTLMASPFLQRSTEQAATEAPSDDRGAAAAAAAIDGKASAADRLLGYGRYRETRCEPAVLSKFSASVDSQLRRQDPDTVAKYFRANGALHGFILVPRPCRRLSARADIVPEGASSIARDSVELYQLKEHVWEEVCTEGQGHKQALEMLSSQINCDIADEEDALMLFLDEMAAKETEINSASTRLNMLREEIEQYSEKIDQNTTMLQYYQSQEESARASLHVAADKLTCVSERLSGAAAGSREQMERLQRQQKTHSATVEREHAELDEIHAKAREIAEQTKEMQDEKQSLCQLYDNVSIIIDELKEELVDIEREYAMRLEVLRARRTERERQQLQRDYWISGEELLVELEEDRILSERRQLRDVD